MGSEWERYSLTEISLSISYGYTESASLEKVGPHFLRITDIQGGIVNWNSVPFCPISDEDHKKYKLHDGDIVIARTGNSTGENFLFTGEKDVVFASYLIRFRINDVLADPKFVWYNLRTTNWWNFIANSKTGSAQAGANATVLGGFQLNLPPLPEQHAIAHILGTLDDKIELNRRMNETLEGISRALFKSWFVDFAPVRAKAEGRDTGLPQEIDDLFPDEFVDSELGEIPKGWEISNVKQQFYLSMGQSPPGESYNTSGQGLPFYQGRSDFGFRFPRRRVYCTSPTRFAKKGDTLVSVRAPVGDINIAVEDCAIGRGVASIRHKSGSTPFTYHSMFFLKSHFEKYDKEGTIFGSINKSTFENIPIIVPENTILNIFEQIASPIENKIHFIEREVLCLSSLRDTLLPKLISGEIRVEDAEKFLGVRKA